ncbi:MAG: flagellar export chaperone FliS [Spirochaetes bacterium]|nr:flagellar export chaperone FliS [Spirochaetota bacterium]
MAKPGKSNPYDKYKETQIKTANQGKLIVMLYDGAIKFLNQAKEFIDKNEIEEAHNKIVRSQDIIMELLLSLNMSAGEIAHKLYNLYLYMNKRLMESNINKDKKPIDEVLTMLLDLKDVWTQISGNNAPGDATSLDKNVSVNVSS